MVMKHQRLGWIARVLRRCPVCGSWLALHVASKNRTPAGKHTTYYCSKCDESITDWKPSDKVKF